MATPEDKTATLHIQAASLIRSFIDLIYPPRCTVCSAFIQENNEFFNQKAFSLCRECLNDFTPIASPLCPICGMPFSVGSEDHVCEACLKKRPFFDRTRAPFLYDGRLMTAIHRFKYGGRSHLAGTLGPLLASFATSRFDDLTDPLVMPIPLHPKRLRERGFNQSLLLARPVAKELKAELDFLSLRRIRYTLPQIGLKSDERRKNVRRAFVLHAGKSVQDRTVILVDDVATTGSTLNECSRVLKKAGAEKVFGLVLARTAGP